jgi:uncharacterized membrane protein YbhN (UPF0104 family)
VAAGVLALAGLGSSVLTWRRCLCELGSLVRVRDAAKIYLVGQLGKYVPGSLWAIVVQMELGRKAGVPRSRSLSASVVAIVVNLATGLTIGLLVIPSVAHGEVWRYATVGLLLVGSAVLLTPPVLTRCVNLLMRALRHARLERPVTWRGICAGASWSLLSWLAYGFSLWILATAAGAPGGESLPLCLAGLALAMTAGFIVVVAPSGIGVREAVVVAALAPVLRPGPALGVALVLRLLFTIADLLAAAASAALRIGPSRTHA